MLLSWDDHSWITPSWTEGPNPVFVLPADLQKNDTEESIPMLPGFEAILKRVPLDDRTGWVFNPVSLQHKIGRSPRHGRPTGDWVGKSFPALERPHASSCSLRTSDARSPPSSRLLTISGVLWLIAWQKLDCPTSSYSSSCGTPAS